MWHVQRTHAALVSEFLSTDSPPIPIFATVLDKACEVVRYSYDFDGVVIHLEDMSCLKAGLHYLFVGKVDPSKVINHSHILRKHVDLTAYTAEGVMSFRRSMGSVLAYVDGGYFLNISCVPVDPNNTAPMFRSDIMAKAHAIGMINAVYSNFTARLKGLPPRDLARASIMKNDLGNLTKMNVLAGDQRFLLDLFMSSVKDVNVDVDMGIYLTLTKFRLRDRGWFDLRRLVDTRRVADISYHVAVNIHPSSDGTVNLLWSHCGLQEVVGQRGTLFSSYSMTETANFQSNLDHLPMDVDPRLMDVMLSQDVKVNFLQLYTVTPHCHTPAAA
ncbi:unnamed protein product [Leuciscus chuanchicus]